MVYRLMLSNIQYMSISEWSDFNKSFKYSLDSDVIMTLL